MGQEMHGLSLVPTARKAVFTAAIVGALFLAACGGSDSDAPQPVAFRSVDQGNSGVTTPQTVVVRDSSAWSTLWSQHTAPHSSPPPAPSVDFGRYMVLGVFLGPRPDGCYSVAMTRVLQDGDNLTVEYHESGPPPGAVCPAIITFPAHLVTVATHRGAVSFVSK